MNGTFLVTGSIFLVIAALVHLYIFFLESVLWSGSRTWRRFGVRSQAEADAIRLMAYNQGFYNAFLAIGVGLGLSLTTGRLAEAGFALALFAGCCMILASIVLVTSARNLWRAALLQGSAPLIGVVLLAVGLQ